MKFPHFFLGFLALNVTAVLLRMAGDLQEGNQNYQRYESTYPADMAAMAYVARVNDLRAKTPQQPLKTTLASVQPYLPAGFSVRLIDESERQETASWLSRSDFVVERTGPPRSPFLTLPDHGRPLTHYIEKRTREAEEQPSARPSK